MRSCYVPCQSVFLYSFADIIILQIEFLTCLFLCTCSVNCNSFKRTWKTRTFCMFKFPRCQKNWRKILFYVFVLYFSHTLSFHSNTISSSSSSSAGKQSERKPQGTKKKQMRNSEGENSFECIHYNSSSNATNSTAVSVLNISATYMLSFKTVPFNLVFMLFYYAFIPARFLQPTFSQGLLLQPFLN